MPSDPETEAAAGEAVSEDPPTAEHSTTQEASAMVVATRLQLKSWLKLWRFFRVNGRVQRQLKADPGLISYSLKADFLRLRFSTLSVWADDPTIDAFLRTGHHRHAMAVFDDIAVRDQSVFTRWQTPAPQDVTWEEAAQRLAAVRPSA